MTTRVVILAAGKGTRMQADVPKALTTLKGKPVIQYLLDAVHASSIDPKPVIVVGQGSDAVRQKLGEGYEYVFQNVQLGTGHAMKVTRPILQARTDAIIVLYCDHPFVHPTTIKKLRFLHEREGRVLSMMTTTVEDFDDWRKPFYDFGRVLRNAGGEIVRVVEKKDATPLQLKIREVNPALYCFRESWLWSHLEQLRNENAQKEYYLTDLVRIAIDSGERIASMDVDPLEAIGVNTPEHLELAMQVA